MVTQSGHIYLIDFGIARFFKEGQAYDTIALGSPGYAPPEQHGSGQTNPRSDLYALGATLHCCLTLRDPYNSPERFKFSPPRSYNPLVPVELDQLVMRLLSFDERQRPGSAQEVKLELRAVRQKMYPRQSSGRIPAVVVAGEAPLNLASPLPQSNGVPTGGPPVAPFAPIGNPPSPYPQQSAPAIQSNSPRFQPPSSAPYRGYQPTQPVQEPLLRRPVMLQDPMVSSRRGQGRGNYSPYATYREPPQMSSPRVWSVGFVLLFFFFLLLTVGGSVVAFNIVQPYGLAHPRIGLDHSTEAGLAVLALLVALSLILFIRSTLAVLLIMLTIVELTSASALFLLQTLRDVQREQIFPQLPPSTLNLALTCILLALGGFSLLWMLRGPFTWSDRFWLFLCFGSICACTLWQYPLPDALNTMSSTNVANDVLIKHLLLVGALIAGIQGLLLAGQMERQRIRS